MAPRHSGRAPARKTGSTPQHARPRKPTLLYIWDDVAYWIGLFISKGIPWVGIGWVAYQVQLSVAALAGEQTSANINIILRAMAEMKADQYIAYIFGFGALGYGYAERRLRISKERQMGRRLRTFEGQLDPHRTSSVGASSQEEDMEGTA